MQILCTFSANYARPLLLQASRAARNFRQFVGIGRGALVEPGQGLGGVKIISLTPVGTFQSGLFRLPYGNIHAGNRVFGQRPAHSGSGQFHPAFGVEEKGAGNRDPFAGGQPLKDFNSVTGTPARLHLARLKEPLAPIDKDCFFKARVEDRVCGYRDGGGKLYEKFDVHKHVGPQGVAGIVHLQTNLECSGRRVENRKNAGSLGEIILILDKEGSPWPRFRT